MTGLCLVASSLVSILVLLDITLANTVTVHPSTDKTIFLSRNIAAACLILWAGFLFFRKHNPAWLGSVDSGSTIRSDSDDHSATTNLGSDSPNPMGNLIQASIRLILLECCADNIVHSLLFHPIIARSVCTYFAIPLTARIWAQYRGVRSIQHSHNDTDTCGEEIDSSIGALLNTLLFVAPCLVLLGGIIGVSMNLRFSVMEMVLVDVAVWTLSLLLMKADEAWIGLHYYQGALLMGLYRRNAWTRPVHGSPIQDTLTGLIQTTQSGGDSTVAHCIDPHIAHLFLLARIDRVLTGTFNRISDPNRGQRRTLCTDGLDSSTKVSLNRSIDRIVDLATITPSALAWEQRMGPDGLMQAIVDAIAIVIDGLMSGLYSILRSIFMADMGVKER
ncbi:MAG: hypothetical protein Q9184_001476 [Pyrenodesmia sp. 2 TL-2023]